MFGISDPYPMDVYTFNENFKAYAFAPSAKKTFLELTPKLNMPNDKRKTFKAYAFARSAKKKF